MNIYKNTKITGTIFFILIIINISALFHEFNNFVNLFELLSVSAEKSTNTRLFYVLFVSLIILLIVFYLIFLQMILQKKVEITKQKEIENIKKKKIIEEKKEKQENKERLREDALKNAKMERILKELEEQLNLKKYCEKFLSNVAKEYDIVQGLFYLKNPKLQLFQVMGTYAFYSDDQPMEFKEGEGLSGQVAKNKSLIYVDKIPENYITILSGLGNSSPKYLLIFPVLLNDESIGIIELASFKPFSKDAKQIFMTVSKIIGQQVQTQYMG